MINHNKKFIPLDLRAKKTHAIRKAPTEHEKNLKTRKEEKMGGGKDGSPKKEQREMQIDGIEAKDKFISVIIVLDKKDYRFTVDKTIRMRDVSFFLFPDLVGT